MWCGLLPSLPLCPLGLVPRRHCRLPDQPLPDGLQRRPDHPDSPLSAGAAADSPGLPHSYRGCQGVPRRLLEQGQGEEAGQFVSSSRQHRSLPPQLLGNLRPGQGWQARSSLRSDGDPPGELGLPGLPALRHDPLIHRLDGLADAARSLQVTSLTLGLT